MFVKVETDDGVTGWGECSDGKSPHGIDGTIRDLGAFRFSTIGDTPRNLFEVRVSPKATADIEVRKYLYDADSPTGNAGFFSGGAGAWVWY